MKVDLGEIRGFASALAGHAKAAGVAVRAEAGTDAVAALLQRGSREVSWGVRAGFTGTGEAITGSAQGSEHLALAGRHIARAGTAFGDVVQRLAAAARNDV